MSPEFHAVLAPLSRGYSPPKGRLPTCYAPVRRAPIPCIATQNCALDLHVLSTPPAFALSQDQTLVCILCRKMKNPESLRGQTSSCELFYVARFPQYPWLTSRQSKGEPNGFWHISFVQIVKEQALLSSRQATAQLESLARPAPKSR